LPHGGRCAWIVGREKNGEHEDQAAGAGDADEDAERERKADGELAVGDQEGDRRGVREDEIPEDWRHEGIGAALVEKAIDPKLEAAVKSELCAEDFILAEDEEEDADADAEGGQGKSIRIIFRVNGDDGLGHRLGSAE